MSARTILLILLALPLIAAFDPQVDVCITPEGCFPYDQTTCEAIENATAYPAPRDGADDAVIVDRCAIGYCCVNGEREDGWTRNTCDATQGSFTTDPVDCGLPQAPACASGGTDCLCGGTEIGAPFICCGGSPTQEASCPADGPVETVPVTCSDNPQCQPGNPPWFDTDVCPTAQNSCTDTCRCAITYEDIDTDDDTCVPGSPNCETATCASVTAPAPAIDGVRSIPGTDRAQISWSFPEDTCLEDVQGFAVLIDAPLSSDGYVNLSGSSFRHEFTVQPETEYTLTVTAQYPSFNKDSEPVEFTSGDERCFGQQRTFCAPPGQNAVLSCDADNNVDTTACVGQGQVCMPSEEGAGCVQRVDCDLCDAAYEAFAEVRLTESITVDLGAISSMVCRTLQGAYTINDQDYRFCYYGHTQSALPEFESCADIGGCEEYLNRASCEENACAVSGGACTWSQDVGVCGATDERYQQCTGESEQECSAQGSQCYWDGRDCGRGDAAVCANYVTQQDCTGGQDFTLQARTLIGTPSQDRFGLGKCVWNGACVKDADRDGTQETDNDFISPQTTLIGRFDLPFSAEISIPFAVTEPATTYAVIHEGSCQGSSASTWSTVPITPHAGNLTFSVDATARGNWCIHYYSKDTNRNVERVRQRQITIDPAVLAFTSIEHTVVSGIEENRSDVAVTFSLNTRGACTTEMIAVGGSGVPLYPRLTEATHTDFRIPYRSLVDGEYRFSVACTTLTGHAAEEEIEIRIDSDGALRDPLPATGTYRTAPNIGIHTRGQGSCTYRIGAVTGDLQQGAQPVRIDGELHYLHLAGPPSISGGVHRATFTCAIGNATIAGGAGDSATFAVDAQPPTISFSVAGEPVQTGSIEVGSGADVTVTCVDASLSGLGANWESGCGELELELNDQALTDLPTEKTLRLSPADTLRARGTDALGNRGEWVTVRAVEYDISGPERPDIEVLA